MKYATVILAVSAVMVMAATATAGVGVVEAISGSAGDWTYTYTLTNNGTGDIYNWAVWFPSDPGADSVTTPPATGWAATHLPSQGFFPKDSLDAGHVIKDSGGNTLAGPAGEPGLFQTYANDFVSNNPGEYWDGDSWELLPDPGDNMWRGSFYGWDGPGADIDTADAILDGGGTGQFSVHSLDTAVVTGGKSFSFSTIDYWYAGYDPITDVTYHDFEGSGTVVPVPGAVLLGAMGLGMVGWLKRRTNKAEA